MAVTDMEVQSTSYSVHCILPNECEEQTGSTVERC